MANAHPLLDNSTMVGGDPAQREPYGYVHSNAEKSIVMLRNPFVRPRTMKLKIDEENGFRKFAGVQRLDLLYPEQRLLAYPVKFGDSLTFDLDSYEQIVAEMRPFASPLAFPPPTLGEDILYRPASLLKVTAGLKITTAIDVSADNRQARFAVLLEPGQEVKDLKTEALDGGKPLTLSVENGGHGVWYWYWADLAPGKHTLEMTIHSGAAGHVSAWLMTRRRAFRQSSSLPDMLPAQNDILRATHLLLEETIR
jgi:hypothetical protein